MATESDSQYSFHMKETSYKSQDLIYEESEHRLIISVEACRSDEFYWGGACESLKMWTVPAGEPISPEKQEQIMERIADWSSSQKTPIRIRPAVTKDEMLASYQQHGYEILHLSERSFVAYRSGSTPPIIIADQEIADYKARGWTVQTISGSPDCYVAFAPDANASSEPESLLLRAMRWLNSRK